MRKKEEGREMGGREGGERERWEGGREGGRREREREERGRDGMEGGRRERGRREGIITSNHSALVAHCCHDIITIKESTTPTCTL